MNAARLLWRARLRASWRPLVILVLVAAMGSGATMAAIAGARRTLGAHDSLLTIVNAFDFTMSSDGTWDPELVDEQLARVDGLDEFSQHVGFVDMASPDIPTDIGQSIFMGPWGGQKTVDRTVVHEGRLGATPDEVALNRTLAEQAGLGVGDRLQVVTLDFETFEPVDQASMRVVGVVAFAEEAIVDEADVIRMVFLSPSYVAGATDRIAWGQALLRVEDQARPGVQSQIEALGFEPRAEVSRLRAQARKSVEPLAVALGGLGLLIGAATVVVVAQSASRLARRSAIDETTLRAIGCNALQRVGVDALIALSVALPAVVIGVGLAAASSRSFPVGSLREVPVLQGAEFDAVVLGGGAVVLAAAFVVAAGLLTRSHRRKLGRDVATGRAPGVIGSYPSVATGMRLATGNRGLITSSAALTFAVLVAVAAIAFNGSLDRLVEEPARSGFSWDLLAKESFSPLDHESIKASILAADGLERASAYGYPRARVNDQVTGHDVVVWESIIGPQFPPLVSGRLPSAPFEALAGPHTLQALDARVGDQVAVTLFGANDFRPDDERVAEHEFTIVGTAVSPAIGEAGSELPRLATGILIDHADVVELLPGIETSESYLFDLEDDVAVEDFRTAVFPNGLPDDFGIQTEWFTSAEPSEVTEAASARPALTGAAIVVAVAVVASVFHGLSGFLRERPRAYGILSALGFSPGQLRTTMLVQGIVGVVLSIAVGVPLGIATGRVLWQAFAGRIGVVPDTSVPLITISAAAVVTILASAAAATVLAARVQTQNLHMLRPD